MSLRHLEDSGKLTEAQRNRQDWKPDFGGYGCIEPRKEKTETEFKTHKPVIGFDSLDSFLSYQANQESKDPADQIYYDVGRDLFYRRGKVIEKSQVEQFLRNNPFYKIKKATMEMSDYYRSITSSSY